ncbi:MAG: right-handed parallel beta-helix repeat-containing protein [candidate division WOR-3 bacterium]
MSDVFEQLLIDLFKLHGDLVFENPQLVKEAAQGVIPSEKAKINAVASAIEEKVPLTLKESGTLGKDELELVWKGFAEGTGIKEELARWAVELLDSVLRRIEEDPELRRYKKRLRAPSPSKLEIKEGLVKMTVIKAPNDSVVYQFDGTTSLVDFIESYLGEGEEVIFEVSGDVEIERPIVIQNKKVIFTGLERSTIFVDILPALEVVKSNVVIENLILKYSKEPERSMGIIFAADSKVEVRNVELQGAGVKLHSSSGVFSKVTLKNCKYLGIFSENSEVKVNGSEFIENGVDIFSPQIRTKGGQIVIKNSKILKGNGAGIWGDACEVNIEKTQIVGNYYYGIYVDAGSTLKISSSRISENGNSEEDYPQVKLISSKAYFKNIKILNGINNTGLWLEDRAAVEADDLKITGHYYHGLVLRADSEAILRGGEIARNGNEDEDRAQVHVESSKALIKDFKIHSGVFNSGLLLDESSTVELFNSFVYKHFYNGISVKSSSTAIVSGCDVFENGSESFHAPQIWVTNGMLKVENSEIREGVKNDGIYARSAALTLENVSIYKHYRRGIYVEGNSDVSISKSRIYENNLGPECEAQIEIKSSNLTIMNSEISTSKNGSGIYVTDISTVNIRGTKVIDNYGLGIWLSSNSSFEISDTQVEGNLGKDGMFPQVLITSSKGKMVNTRILRGLGVGGVVVERSFLQLVESVIKSNERSGLYILSNSIFEGTLCEIRENGSENKEYPQVKVENSKFILKSSQVIGGINNTGISVIESSFSEIEKSIVSGHLRHGIEVYYNSELVFSDGDIFENGSEEENCPQVWIGSSYAKFRNSKIRDGRNNMGIGVLKSYVEIDACEIYGHKDAGVNISWYSGVKMKDSRIYKNASNSDSAQINILSSRAMLRNCEIYGSLNGQGIKVDDASIVEIDNSRIYENKNGGIHARENSELKISGCEINKNNELDKKGAQVIIDNARSAIKNSKILEGIEGSGIKINASLITEIFHTVIAEHKGCGIEVVDNFSRLRVVGVNTYRNAQGGLIYKNPYKLSVIDSTFEDGSIRKS